jgi:type I restriction enzyme S subunit
MEIKVMEAEVLDGFKMTEFGILPEEWEVVKLQNAFEFTRKPRNVNSKYYNKIPFIPMEYVPDEEIYASRYDLKSPKEIRSGTFFSKGDLLVAKITPSFENGKQCIVENLPVDFGYATTEVWPLRGKNNSHLLYLFYYLKKQNIRNDIAGKMEGSTGRQRVPKNVLGNLRIPLPPLPEQQRIAAVLSAVQEAKEKTEEVIKAARELKKSLMHHLFTYGAVPVGDVGDVVLKETEIGAVPEEWEVMRLGDVAKIVSGGTPSRKKTEYWNGKIPWVKTGEVNYNIITKTNEKISELGLENSSTRFIPSGTLLMAMYGQGITRGRVAILGIDATINQACAAIFFLKNFNIYSFSNFKSFT